MLFSSFHPSALLWAGAGVILKLQSGPDTQAAARLSWVAVISGGFLRRCNQRFNVCATPTGRAANLDGGGQFAIAHLSPDGRYPKVKNCSNFANSENLFRGGCGRFIHLGHRICFECPLVAPSRFYFIGETKPKKADTCSSPKPAALSVGTRSFQTLSIA